IVVGRSGEVRVVGANGRILSTNNIPYGSDLKVVEGQKVERGDEICRWDPYNAVILSEFDGEVVFENLIENATYQEELDEQTGYRGKIVTDSKDRTVNPSIKVMDSEGTLLRS